MTEPISAIASVASGLDELHAVARSPALDNLADKFASLMQAAPTPSVAIQPPGEPSALMRTLEAQESMFKQTVTDMNSLRQDADRMSMNAVASEQMRLTMELAVSSVQFSFASQVAQDANKSLQTLLKNQ